MCDDFRFFKGEKRIITGTVIPENHCEKIVIASATFELTKKQDRQVIHKGVCEVSGDTAKIFLDLTDVLKGSYELRLSADVGAERIIKTQNIEVI